MSHKRLAKKLLKILKEAQTHLEYCGYGDSWERECAKDLPDIIDNTVKHAENILCKNPKGLKEVR